MLGEHLGEGALRVGFGIPMRTKLLTNFQAPAPIPGKQPSRPQFRHAAVEKPIVGVVDEIVGFDGAEPGPALRADQKMLFQCGRPGRQEAAQRIILEVPGRLVAVDTYPRAHHNANIGNQQTGL